MFDEKLHQALAKLDSLSDEKLKCFESITKEQILAYIDSTTFGLVPQESLAKFNDIQEKVWAVARLYDLALPNLPEEERASAKNTIWNLIYKVGWLAGIHSQNSVKKYLKSRAHQDVSDSEIVGKLIELEGNRTKTADELGISRPQLLKRLNTIKQRYF